MALIAEKKRTRIIVRGKVQGVGFRPAVYKLASERGLCGWVKNSSRGVEIEAEGALEEVESFVEAILAHCPPGASVRGVDAAYLPPEGDESFRIAASSDASASSLEITPDIGICDKCAEEIKSPADRRYLYPFTNCTDCGPRFTIISGVPYDRKKTTMKNFVMCRECEREYSDPGDRRFHAQPNACPECGPAAELTGPNGISTRGISAVRRASECIKSGGIVAIKGLGGFNIACDAANEKAVKTLRRKKLRGRKPFALMAENIGTVKQYCAVSKREEALLLSPAGPVVLLLNNGKKSLPYEISYASRYLGFMLAYTPLHRLLFSLSGPGMVLVMTSGNISGEPVIFEDSAAFRELSGICDFILGHDRVIYSPCDDSVSRILPGGKGPYPVRRSRGCVPEPVFLKFKNPGPAVFAAGGDLKNTFCLAEDGRFMLSQHIGDLSDVKTYGYYARSVKHLKKLLRVKPEIYACDMHPGYNSSAYAMENCPAEPIRIQHHHAHIAACMADNGLPGGAEVIGVAFDGTGYGPDGSVWGGEFLTAGYGGFRREASLRQMRLPGGEKAVLEPWRIAVSLLYDSFGEEFMDFIPEDLRKFGGEEIEIVKKMLDAGINCPFSSGAGRLFDGVSALLGLCGRISYEGEAAAELEAAAGEEEGEYEFGLDDSGVVLRLDYAPAVKQIAWDVKKGVSKGAVSGKFHAGLAAVTCGVCLLLREKNCISEVALSGGVFQNINFLGKVRAALEREGFKVYIHGNVPPNDGGLSLGQAAAASYMAGSRL